MAIQSVSIQVRVSPSPSSAGLAWSVYLADECQSVFVGANARGRALDAALRLTEEVRATAPVLLVVEAASPNEKATRVARTRLAS